MAKATPIKEALARFEKEYSVITANAEKVRDSQQHRMCEFME